MTEEAIKIGGPVVYVDEFGKEHDALVTNAWAGLTPPSCNVVYVSDSTEETDQYGRQIKRATSVVHEKHQAAHGRFWRE